MNETLAFDVSSDRWMTAILRAKDIGTEDIDAEGGAVSECDPARLRYTAFAYLLERIPSII